MESIKSASREALREQLSGVREEAVVCARKLADWLLACQLPTSENRPDSGDFYWDGGPDNDQYYANNWNLAFAIMGLLSASREFGEERYLAAAIHMGRYLKTLQIFDPFHKADYGAFREMTPQTSWCYVRDALSAAWGMLELYRCTGEPEYLERADLWYQWFRRRGMDESGWPWWGVRFDPPLTEPPQPFRNDLHGCFHGGSLNFFYRMYQTTGNRDYVGGFYENIADRFVSEIQQDDGFFRSTDAQTGKVPDDPQNGLHRGNDDLGSLGLAGAYRLLGKQSYADAINLFLEAVFARQNEDGSFETYCAANPVILNTVFETEGLFLRSPIAPDALLRTVKLLFARQFHLPEDRFRDGSFDEYLTGHSCARSSCYALIVFIKIFGKSGSDLLSIDSAPLSDAVKR